MRTTEAKVFIVESLNFDDEQRNRFEGRFLSQILHLGEKESAYCYVQTKQEFSKSLRLFQESQYRYLHLSCHGNNSSISTTLDLIPFTEFGKLVRPYMRGKRLFLSVCSAANENLAENIIPLSGCLSVVGPARGIPFNDAAVVWASFYHLMFKEDSGKMGRADMTTTLKKVATTSRVPLNYYSVSEEHGFKGDRITAGGKIKRIYP